METEKSDNGSDFWVECNVCKQKLKNWTGSTPCCGSIAWIVEDGKPTTKINLFASVGGEQIKPTEIDLGNPKPITGNQTVDFGMYLTGHSEETVKKLFDEFNKPN